MKFFLIIFLISINVFAQNNNLGFGNGQEYPFDNKKVNIPAEVQQKRYKLSIDKDKVNNIQRNIYRQKEIMNETLDISILQKPLKKPLKTVDTIFLHPSFITTIIMPTNLTLSDCTPSFDTTVFRYEKNIFYIQPTREASVGNITIALTDGVKNYTITLFVKKYFKELDCVNEGENYKCADDYLSTIIQYAYPKRLDTITKLQIVEKYLRLHNKEKLTISKNLDFVTLKDMGETFYIIRDDEFGKIFKDGIRLTIKDSIN